MARMHRRIRIAEDLQPNRSATVLDEVAIVHGGLGDLRRTPSLESRVRSNGTYGATDSAAVSQVLCQAEKNDANSAAAIVVAVTRATMHSVPVKTMETQCRAMVSHARQLLVRRRRGACRRLWSRPFAGEQDSGAR